MTSLAGSSPTLLLDERIALQITSSQGGRLALPWGQRLRRIPMGTVELVLTVVTVAALWVFIRALRKGVNYWFESSPHQDDDD